MATFLAIGRKITLIKILKSRKLFQFGTHGDYRIVSTRVFPLTPPIACTEQ